MQSSRNLFQDPAPKQPQSKATFTLRHGKILLGTYDNAAEAWRRFDVLLASGVDVTVEVIPAVL
jgi:hypothetical protein